MSQAELTNLVLLNNLHWARSYSPWKDDPIDIQFVKSSPPVLKLKPIRTTFKNGLAPPLLSTMISNLRKNVQTCISVSPQQIYFEGLHCKFDGQTLFFNCGILFTSLGKNFLLSILAGGIRLTEGLDQLLCQMHRFGEWMVLSIHDSIEKTHKKTTVSGVGKLSQTGRP